MGFTVSGIRPTANVGKSFTANVWGWRPLAQFVCKLAPDLSEHCKCWQTNDGDGLNATHASELATRLTRAIETGVVEDYAAQREAWLATLERSYEAYFQTLYVFDVDRTRAFRDFVAASGGFVIL